MLYNQPCIAKTQVQEEAREVKSTFQFTLSDYTDLISLEEKQ